MKKTGSLKVLSKITALVITAIMAMAFVGCKNNNVDSNKSQINIKDIEWDVKAGIIDGQRVLTSYGKNNSKFPLVFGIKFCLKEDVTSEELDSFYSFVKKSNEIYDSDEYADEEFEEIINEGEVSINTKFILEPGDTFDDIPLNCYGGIMTDMGYYDLFEPDIMGIHYISDNTIYLVYYDFKSNEYTQSKETSVAYDWTEYEIGTKIPKLEAAFVEKNHETETHFECTAQFISEEKYNSYIEDCEAMGYTIDEYTYDSKWYGTTNFSAKNAEGYAISLELSPYYHIMKISISAP